jgi:ketosteroid isomerase-like protein
MNHTRPALVALACALFLGLGALPASATPQGDVLATVTGFIAGFNAGDIKKALATCASPASIVDDFPPHEWQGPTACADWIAAYGADAASNGITDGSVTLGTPWHVDVEGARAYVVVPATYTYKQRGKPVTESGSVLTVALKKAASRWLITGWAWARH